MPLSSRKEVTRYVHRKVLFRLRRLTVFFIVVTVILVFEIRNHYIAWWLVVLGLLMGFCVGLAVKRMHILSWDKETEKAVTRMDTVGWVILVAYLLFAILRHWIFSHWLQGHMLTAFTLSIASGGLIGRLCTLRQTIRKILKQQGFLHPVRD
jgi:hypothetical protein